jgi:hypothetical protein
VLSHFKRKPFRAPHPDQAESLRQCLSLDPWTWPPEGSAAYKEAFRLLPDGPPRSVRPDGTPTTRHPGQTPLLATRGEKGADLFLFEVVPQSSRKQPTVGFKAGLEAWSNAIAALSTAVPYLWRPVSDLPSAAPSVVRIADRGAHMPLRLERGSFGLSFLLALASHVLGQALDCDVVASAQVLPNGLLLPVDGLESKLQTLISEAPGLRRLIVAADQELSQEALDLAHGQITIVAFRTAAQAVEALLEPSPRFQEAAEDPESREKLIRSLFRLALSERHAAPAWGPVAEACATVAEQTTNETERRQLALCSAIAKRHDGATNSTIPLPTADELSDLSGPARLRFLSHLTQQAADTGSPSPRGMLDLAKAHLPVAGADVFPDHLRLKGAVGRLLATIGEHEASLRLQVETAHAWREVPWEHGISYPLSESYRLARVLEQASQLQPLEELRGEALVRGLLRVPTDTIYVDLSRGSALLTLGTPLQRKTGQTILSRLWDDSSGLFPGVCAARWLHYEFLAQSPQQAEVVRTRLATHVEDFGNAAESAIEGAKSLHRNRENQAARTLALCKLDLALESSNEADVQAAVSDLRERSCELVAVLEKRAPSDGAFPAFLARHFPY